MAHVIKRPVSKELPSAEHHATIVRLVRIWRYVKGWFVGLVVSLHLAHAARRNVDKPRRWHHRQSWWLMPLAILGGLISLAWTVLGFYAMIADKQQVVFAYCDRAGTCGIVSGFVAPFLALGSGTAAFLAWPVWRVTRKLKRMARNTPRELVPTAGTITGDIVGRDELCQVIMRILRYRGTRHPCILVGGVGTGKTTVIVRLTELLARRWAVVIPVGVRNVESDLDFAELAQKRFYEIVNTRTLPSGQAEKIWRQLRRDDLVVVLADGLEEVFPAGSKEEKDRDNLIRQAIKRADEQRLPLLITSRPHRPLEATTAALMELEPLSEEAALGYVEQDTRVQDEHRLDWIVESANVAEAPLYLQMTRTLHRRGRLEHLTPRGESRLLDTRGVDSSALRWRLLDTWQRALTSGHLHPELRLRAADREETIAVVAALACIGLLSDSIEVAFEDLTGADGSTRDRMAGGGEADSGRGSVRASRKVKEPTRILLWSKLRATMKNLPENADIHYVLSRLSLAATRGEQLSLVEAFGNRVRFPHSILEAQLGSRFLDVLLQDSGSGLREALAEPGPGRELLIALVLHSREEVDALENTGNADRASNGLVRMLLVAAQNHYEAKAFDIYAAALEIDSVQPRSIQDEIAKSLAERWEEIKDSDLGTLEEAKLGVVRRFGDALREVARRNNGKPAYDYFKEIACTEESYPVRLAIGQEIGAGGDAAFDALCRSLLNPAGNYENRLDEQEQKEQVSRAAEIADVKRSEDVRRQQLLTRGRAETDAERRRREDEERNRREKALRTSKEAREEIWREFVLRAWLAPLLVASVGDEYREDATGQLKHWLSWREGQLPAPVRPMPISFEIALAQGFKYAANRRMWNPYTCDEARSCLAGYAEELLEHSRYWFTHLTLVQALTLWALPDSTSTVPSANAPNASRGHAASAGRSVRDGNGAGYPRHQESGPREQVRRWLEIAGAQCPAREPHPGDVHGTRQRVHPFVAEAGDLAVLALQTGHPERFLWIDESGITGKVGSQPAEPARYRKHNLWIPASAGWSALGRRAQQLVADVLVMLNLTEQSGSAHPQDSRERRLERADRATLPPCLTTDRRPLQPTRTIGWAETAAPGSTCLNDCQFELCPYPPAGGQPRAELTEAFCRRQHALLGHRLMFFKRKTAPWQGMTPRQLRSFWEQMIGRTRTLPRPEE